MKSLLKQTFSYFFSMASLLAKFRIDYSALKVISGISKPAQKQTVSFFESLIQEFMEADDSTKTEVNSEGN